MALVTVIPQRIGDEMREAGYPLTAEDMKGRNIARLLKHGHIKDVPDPAPSRRSRKSDGADGDE